MGLSSYAAQYGAQVSLSRSLGFAVFSVAHSQADSVLRLTRWLQKLQKLHLGFTSTRM